MKWNNNLLCLFRFLVFTEFGLMGNRYIAATITPSLQRMLTLLKDFQ